MSRASLLAAAAAGLFYLDAGVSLHWSEDNLYYYEESGEIAYWPNPLATFEAGYQNGRITIFAAHTSSTQARDSGLNEVGVRYRLLEW